VSNQWDGGFQGTVTVTNTGATPLSLWRVSWTYTGGQRLSQLWNATLTADGGSIAVTRNPTDSPVAAGGTTGFGFVGSWAGSNPVPEVTCTVL
jgi:cellulase/cellobiase CelA1